MQLLQPYKKLGHGLQAIYILLYVKYHFVQDINIFIRNHVAVHNEFAVWLLPSHINADIANQLFIWNCGQRINYKLIFEATNAMLLRVFENSLILLSKSLFRKKPFYVWYFELIQLLHIVLNVEIVWNPAPQLS